MAAIGLAWADGAWVEAGWASAAWAKTRAAVPEVTPAGAFPTKRVRFKNKYYRLPRDRAALARAMQEWLVPEPPKVVTTTAVQEPVNPAVSIESDDGIKIAVIDPPEFTKRDLGVLERRLEDLHFQRERIDSFLIAIHRLREMEQDEEDALIAILMVA